MNNKKIILILSLMILILTLNSISATTIDSNSTVSTDSYNIESNDIQLEENVKSIDNIIYVNQDSQSTIEDGSENAPYKTISDETIASISPKSTIQVSKGTYNINPIVFDKDITIVGENTDDVIFIPNEGRSVFTINEGVTVNFKDFTLKDYTSDNSAAIINNGKIIMENLNLLNNVGTSTANMGGSILNNGDLEVTNTTFDGNQASFGAAIYSNANVVIKNSTFTNSHIYNVGGAIYSVRGNLEVYDSIFEKNVAVSGAAIYNAAGYLYVNNTNFLSNNAEFFFGGAIYSTGVTITNNSRFIKNRSTKDGGAITNTNNFTIDNCYFEENFSIENGGVIENVPWSIDENGNLTITNSIFLYNYGKNGGVIMNYNKPDAVGDFCTVTARNNIFDSNSAEIGGVIYSEQFVDFQYNVIINNEADKNNDIYVDDEELIVSIDNNWWGTNNPTEEHIGAMPNNWIVMSFTNTTALVTDLSSELEVSLNTLNTGKTIDNNVAVRNVTFSAQDTVFNNENVEINGSFNEVVTPLGDELTATIDNQSLSLTPVDSNITYSLINDNKTLEVKIELPKNVNGKSSVKINSKTIINKARIVNGSLTLTYDIPASWNKDTYNLDILVSTQANMSLRKENLTLNIPKRNVVAILTVKNDSEIKAGKTIQLIGTVKLDDQIVNSGKVSFKINNKTIQSKVKIVNGQAVLNYTIPENFVAKTYNLSMVYSGDANKNSAISENKITLEKQDVHTTLTDTITVNKNSNTIITVNLLDENNNAVCSGKACYKFNGKTVETNITITNGVFEFTYVAPDVTNNSKLTQILTIKYGANSKYNSLAKDIELIIK